MECGWSAIPHGTNSSLLTLSTQPSACANSPFGGYTRGLAVGPDHLYVGISARRRAGDRRNDTASLAIVDRRTWSVVDRCPVPCPEIYDVRLVPMWAPSILAAPLPMGQQNAISRLRNAKCAIGATKGSGGIPAGISIRFEPPKAIHAGDVLFVPARVEHGGLTPLDSHAQRRHKPGIPLDRRGRIQACLCAGRRTVADCPSGHHAPEVIPRCRCRRSSPRNPRALQISHCARRRGSELG